MYEEGAILMNYFADDETLPNGIYIRKKTYWDDREVASWPLDKPWLATINVGGWHYSSKGEATKEQAVNALLNYMRDQLKVFQKQLASQQNKINELNAYLEKQNG